MKKIIAIILATMLLSSVAVFAAVPDVKAGWTNTVHVSNDIIKSTAGNVTCDNDDAKINYLTVPAGTADATFWGWVSGDNAAIEGFYYSVNGGEKATDAAFTVPAEDAVINAGKGAYDSRYDVKVPLTEGTQLVRVYVKYADGKMDAIWACEVTVGAASDYTDNEAAPSTPSTPSTPSNPETGDAMIIAIVAVATVALAGVAVSKKIHA